MQVKNLISTFLLLFNLFIIFQVNPAFAEERKLPRPPADGGTLIINWSELSLSTIQQEKIRGLRLDFQQLSVKLRSQIDLKQIEIEKLLVAPYSDPDQIRKLLRERISLDSKLRMSALDNFLLIKSLLTSDQLAKLPRAVNLK